MVKTIIIEGCDRTGKTTLANNLKKHFGYNIIHLGIPPDVGYYDKLVEMLDGNQNGIIFDRFHWGDRIYTGITRNYNCLSELEFCDIELKLERMNAVVIFCTDTHRNIMERFHSKNEKLIHPLFVPLILSRYTRIIGETNIRTLVHNHAFDPKAEQIINNLKNL